jgi:hypothetical protein
MVLSMKGWSNAQRAKFVTAFVTYLQAHNDRVPVHVVMEEADAFIPQQPREDEAVMLGACDRLIRWGRQDGIGATAISQRSAAINKNVTTQCETLVAHRTIGPQDRDAVEAWIKYHGTREEREVVLSSLAVLADGEAWVWSPEWLHILLRIRLRRRSTFDSASTPKIGQKRIEPRHLAAVDIEKLRGQLATTIEQAKANDPKELRKRVQALTHELEMAQRSKLTAKVVEKVRRVEVEIIPAELTGILLDLTTDMDVLRGLGGRIEAMGKRLDRVKRLAAKAPKDVVIRSIVEPGRRPMPASPPAAAPARVAPTGNQTVPRGEGVITPSQRKVLDALAWCESANISPANRTQVAFLAGYTPDTGTFNNYLGALRTAGLIDYPTPGYVALTADGRHEAAVLDVPLTPEALHATLYSKLGRSLSKLLQVVIERYPDSLSRAELAEITNYAPDTGTFNNYLGRLRSLGLIDYPAKGYVAGLPVLMLEGAA